MSYCIGYQPEGGTRRLGDIVAIASPSYHGMMQILNATGLKALEIPTDPVPASAAGVATLLPLARCLTFANSPDHPRTAFGRAARLHPPRYAGSCGDRAAALAGGTLVYGTFSTSTPLSLKNISPSPSMA